MFRKNKNVPIHTIGTFLFLNYTHQINNTFKNNSLSFAFIEVVSPLMKAVNITERIRRIKDHIGRASLKTAFEDLEDLIRSIDGMEIENEEEREFINQLITIKARYNTFNDSVITGIGAQQEELNLITNALLTLTDSVQELLAANPDLIVPEKPEEITANLAIPTDTVTTTHPLPPSSGADNSGCLFSFSKSADQTNVNVQANWLKIFGGLALFILALALGFKLIFGMKGCNQEPITAENKLPPVVQTPPPPLDPEKNSANTPIISPTNSSQDIEKMAKILGEGKTSGRGQASFSNISFGKNSITLNAKAKTELDHMAMILKQVPDQKIMISATVGPDESISYRGNKEITLGDVRAREMFNYLKSKGVPITQMEFEGGGVSDPQRAMIELYR